MKERIEKIKEHLAENKKTYIACGLTAVGTGLVFLVVSRTNVDSSNSPQIKNVICWQPKNNQVVLNFTERSTPSKPVHLVGTNLYFDSLGEAARATGHRVSDISAVANGHRPHVGNDVFQFLDKV